jgi:arylsulfatase A-like enzyme
MKMIALLLSMVSLSCVSNSPSNEPSNEPAIRPNILFIFTDDHSTAAIGAYGSEINETPQLDRLAGQGMLFERVFCTNSICAPSRAVILNGKHSSENGVLGNGDVFDGEQMTFP